MIYFNNKEVKPTVDYYVQQLYGQNAGNEYITSKVSLDNNQVSVRKRVGVSVVRDVSSGDLIIKLVNLLPVSVNAELELPSLKGKNVSAVKTVLAGQPNDAKARPVSCLLYTSDADDDLLCVDFGGPRTIKKKKQH